RRVERYLATAEDPADELKWPADEAATEVRFSPMALLGLMGVCKAINVCARVTDEGRLPTPEEVVEAAQPKGRIGRALVRFALALPESSASYELVGKSMDVKFSDGLDCYRVFPRSRELAKLVGRHGPEAAADRMLAEYQRLGAERARIVTAFRLGLP